MGKSVPGIRPPAGAGSLLPVALFPQFRRIGWGRSSSGRPETARRPLWNNEPTDGPFQFLAWGGTGQVAHPVGDADDRAGRVGRGRSGVGVEEATARSLETDERYARKPVPCAHFRATCAGNLHAGPATWKRWRSSRKAFAPGRRLSRERGHEIGDGSRPVGLIFASMVLSAKHFCFDPARRRGHRPN